ncbi:retinol dehydrogenase 12 [Solenopsis invicta]|uniref:retinol dehydrogenase 12 n=1 Tax=Solenopsis invicta TaxID=13686 RepID=UPI000E33DE74|nr:retinol dehydrogenase 12 [Solenopsis invicta]
MRFLNNKMCASKARIDNKTVVITGASDGIGKETARDLYARGGKIIMACRNMEKANQAMEDIKNNPPSYIKVTKEEYIKNAGELAIYILDLTSIKSVIECARNLLTNESTIDILINNAGVATQKSNGKTEDGIQITFQVNYLGHFILTLLLLSKMKSSSNCRIVNVSSIAHIFGSMHFDDINLERTNSPLMSYAFKSYAQSKLANILFTKELTRRLKEADIHEINVYCLHPGIIPTIMLEKSTKDIFLSPIINFFLKLFYKNVEEGAQTTVYCSVAEETANETGLYYSNCDVATTYREANNNQHAKKLWNLSCRLLNLEPDDNFNTFLETVSRQMLLCAQQTPNII